MAYVGGRGKGGGGAVIGCALNHILMSAPLDLDSVWGLLRWISQDLRIRKTSGRKQIINRALSPDGVILITTPFIACLLSPGAFK